MLGDGMVVIFLLVVIGWWEREVKSLMVRVEMVFWYSGCGLVVCWLINLRVCFVKFYSVVFFIVFLCVWCVFEFWLLVFVYLFFGYFFIGFYKVEYLL